MNNQIIAVSTVIHSTYAKPWCCGTDLRHILKWNHASENCHNAENDCHRVSKFSLIMAAKDGSPSFDFSGTFNVVMPEKYIEYAPSR